MVLESTWCIVSGISLSFILLMLCYVFRKKTRVSSLEWYNSFEGWFMKTDEKMERVVSRIKFEKACKMKGKKEGE